MSESLTDREKKIVKTSFTSAGDLRMVRAILEIPSDVRGLKIVDIGSGCSSAVAELRNLGADSYGIDPRYRNIKELDKSFNGYMLGISARIRELRKFVSLDTTESEELITQTTYKEMNVKAFAEFKKDLKRNPQKYLASLAGRLPFDSECVDLAFSVQCLTKFLINDKDVFFNSIEEGLRVLKPSVEGTSIGQLQLQPWFDGTQPWHYEISYIDTASQLLDHLRARDIPYKVRQSVYGSPHLKIFKR